MSRFDVIRTSFALPETNKCTEIVQNLEKKKKNAVKPVSSVTHGTPNEIYDQKISRYVCADGATNIPIRSWSVQDLMDIMFDESFPVDNQALPGTLAVDNVIFVFENVDSTSPIVRSREIDGNNGWESAEPEKKQTCAKKV